MGTRIIRTPGLTKGPRSLLKKTGYACSPPPNSCFSAETWFSASHSFPDQVSRIYRTSTYGLLFSIPIIWDYYVIQMNI